jgi:CRISPR system Cascade subunit CasE
MHLAQLRLDLRNKDVRRDLANPYDMHRTLSRAFVQNESDSPPRFLWRIWLAGDRKTSVILVQSAHRADWAKLEAMPGYLLELHGQKVESKTFRLEQLLRLDALYRFCLCANPTVKKNGKRRGLAGTQGQLEWLRRQGERHGFEVKEETAFVSASEILEGHKCDQRIHLQRVYYEGLLRIVDPETATQALLKGIGPGKAFGCGLLSLAPWPGRNS